MIRTRTSHLYLILALAIGLTACGSSRPSPPCNPELDIRYVPAPYPVILVMELLPPLRLEVVPPMAPDDATPEEKKATVLAIAEATEKNTATLIARDEAWTMKIEHHNSLAEDVRRNEPE